MKLHRMISIATAALMIAPPLLADTTVHYKYEVKFGAAWQAAGAAMAAVQAKIPKTSLIQIKGKLGRTTASQYVVVSDFDKQVVTLIDPAQHQYATVYMKDYADQVESAMQALPKMSAGAQKKMDSMQSTFASHETGRTDIIAGIKAGETEMTLTVSMPIPVGTGSSTDAAKPVQPQVLFQMVMHVWSADPSELQRFPALNEFSAVYGDPSAQEVLLPNGSMQKLFESMPGMGKGFGELVQARQAKRAVILKTHEELFMPMLNAMAAAQARAKAAEQGQTADQTAASDEKEPLMDITVEVDDISGAPIDDAVFAVPRDCELVSVPDLLKANQAAAQAGGSSAPEPSAPSIAQDPASPVE
jgi:hypothetical protein